VTEPTFAELVDQAATRLGITDHQLALAITKRLPEGQGYNSKQVSRIRAGELRRPSAKIVEALIDVFAWDEEQEAVAWTAAGLAPPGTTAEDLRRIVARRRRRSDRQLAVVPADPAAVLRTSHVQSGDCTELARVA
jgi:hypothetical protein